MTDPEVVPNAMITSQEGPSYITVRDGKCVGYVGDKAIDCFRAYVIASALKLYAETGMKANRTYTPLAMIKAANQITGHVYRRGQYNMAAAALIEWADKRKAELPKVGE